MSQLLTGIILRIILKRLFVIKSRRCLKNHQLIINKFDNKDEERLYTGMESG